MHVYMYLCVGSFPPQYVALYAFLFHIIPNFKKLVSSESITSFRHYIIVVLLLLFRLRWLEVISHSKSMHSSTTYRYT